jgi:hypothetical protein
MLKNRKSFLNNFIIAKDEFVSMKLHFRYHTYLYAKKGGTVYDGCKYCNERLLNVNGESMANKNENENDGERDKKYSNADKK